MVCAFAGAKAALYDDITGHADYDVTLSAPGEIGSKCARVGFRCVVIFAMRGRRELKSVGKKLWTR